MELSNFKFTSYREMIGSESEEAKVSETIAPMATDIGRALAATGTSNSWSPLDAVASKVGKRLGRTITPR